MPDAGSVQVRFTVANAEVVRQALAQLGKDGEAALKAFDSSAQSSASGGDTLAKALADVAASPVDRRRRSMDRSHVAESRATGRRA